MTPVFQFARLPLIFFGGGEISRLPGLIKRYGTNIILVTGNSSFLNSLYGETTLNLFQNEGIKYSVAHIPDEPSPEMIDNIVNRFKNEPVNVVVGIGGGSVIDAGKAISAMMFKPDPVREYLEGVGKKVHPGTKLPFIAVPTTSGTGSEATKNSVISSVGETGFKKSLRHDNFVPDIAIVDPNLTLTCPAEITSASGMDCFTQLVEAYLSDKSCTYTDALAIEGIKAVKDSLINSVTNGSDQTARGGMAFAALTSGICLANAGLGVVHGFASSIGGRYKIPHGQLCGTLMAPSNAVNVRELRKNKNNIEALKKYSILGRIFNEEEGKSDNYFIDSFIQYLAELTDYLHLPLLNRYGITDSDLALFCTETEIKNNPVRLSREDLIEIVSHRL